jgi:hypothetical protein
MQGKSLMQRPLATGLRVTGLPSRDTNGLKIEILAIQACPEPFQKSRRFTNEKGFFPTIQSRFANTAQKLLRCSTEEKSRGSSQFFMHGVFSPSARILGGLYQHKSPR